MTPETLQSFFLWCTIIDYGVLLLWFALFVSVRPWLRRLHGRWFRLSDELFDALHYSGMGLFKLGILLFNLAPYLALRIVG
jgi:hypothetical protein